MCNVSTFDQAWFCLNDQTELFYQSYPDLKPFDNGLGFWDLTLQEDGLVTDDEMTQFGTSLAIEPDQCTNKTPDECKLVLAKQALEKVLKSKPKPVVCAFHLGSYPLTWHKWANGMSDIKMCKDMAGFVTPIHHQEREGGSAPMPDIRRF